jgi:outer membrane protein assembly factor BamB
MAARRIAIGSAAAAALSLLLAVAAQADGWRQYRGDDHRSGAATWTPPSSSAPGLPVGKVVWNTVLAPGKTDPRSGTMAAPTPVMVEQSPVVGPDGTIYVGTWEPDQGGGRLTALNPNGSVKWSTRLDGYDVRSTPAVRSDGKIVVEGVRYFRAANGAWDGRTRLFLVSRFGLVEARSQELDDAEPLDIMSPLLDPGDTAYYWFQGALLRLDPSFATTAIRIVDPVIGSATRWCGIYCATFDPYPAHPDRTPIEALGASPALGCNDVVAAGSAGARSRLARVRPFGKVLWATSLIATTTPAVGLYGRAYYGTSEGRVEARDQNGTVAWSRKLGGYAYAPAALGRGTKDPGDVSTISCVFENADGSSHEEGGRDHVYIPATDGFLYALDYKSRLRWKTPVAAPGNRAGAPVVVRDARSATELILIPMRNPNALAALDRYGRLVWVVLLDGPALGTPGIANGRIYVATETSVYAVR